MAQPSTVRAELVDLGASRGDAKSRSCPCPSFIVGSGTGQECISQQVTPAPPVDGHQAFLLTLSATFPASGEHIPQGMLFVLDGTDQVAVSEYSYNSPVPASHPLAATAVRLIPQVERFSQSIVRCPCQADSARPLGAHQLDF
jgi:hypothetical protein